MTLNIEERRETAVLADDSAQEIRARLGLLRDIGEKVGSVPKLAKLVEHATQMTQRTLNASASSVLLFDDEERDLFFDVVEGQAGQVLRQVRLDTQSGIAGWVARHGKPLIVNDVAKDERFDESVDEITGFATRSIICAPLVVHRKIVGVVEVLNKNNGSNFDEQDLETIMSVASTIGMAVENTKLHRSILDAYKITIKALAAAIDAKDHYTCGHSQRVVEYALLGGTSLSFPREELEVLEYAGILHDIGKIGITDSILSKPERLTSDEWDVMLRHPGIGANIIRDVPFLEKARTLILHHHEKHDGSGYPDGLRYKDIPIGARLLAVADAFDTMTTDRSYRAAPGIEYAIEELRRCSGTQFCPVVVEAFISGLERHQSPTVSIAL